MLILLTRTTTAGFTTLTTLRDLLGRLALLVTLLAALLVVLLVLGTTATAVMTGSVSRGSAFLRGIGGLRGSVTTDSRRGSISVGDVSHRI